MAKTMRVECATCGSRYELTGCGETQRERGNINCEVCGLDLHSWNAAVTWEARLIERKENHLPATARNRKPAICGNSKPQTRRLGGVSLRGGRGRPSALTGAIPIHA